MIGQHALQLVPDGRGGVAFRDSWSPTFGGMMPERTAPRPATHLEITIRYTVRAEKANVGSLLEILRDGLETEEEPNAVPGGKVELVRIKAVPAPE